MARSGSTVSYETWLANHPANQKQEEKNPSSGNAQNTSTQSSGAKSGGGSSSSYGTWLANHPANQSKNTSTGGTEIKSFGIDTRGRGNTSYARQEWLNKQQQRQQAAITDTRGRGSTSGARSKWIDEHGLPEQMRRPASAIELGYELEDYKNTMRGYLAQQGIVEIPTGRGTTDTRGRGNVSGARAAWIDKYGERPLFKMTSNTALEEERKKYERELEALNRRAGNIQTAGWSDELEQQWRTASAKLKEIDDAISEREAAARPTQTAAELRLRELKTRAERELDELNRSIGYNLTTEQSDAFEQQRRGYINYIAEIEKALGEAPQAHDARQRAENFFGSWGHGTAASYANAAGNMLEVSDYGGDIQRELAELDAQIERAETDYRETVSASGRSSADARAALNTLNELKEQRAGKQAQYEADRERIDAQSEKNRGWAESIYSKADELQDKADEQYSIAKSGLGAGSAMLMDAAKTGMDIAADTAFATVTGGSGLIPMSVRVYGATAQEARRGGDDARTAAAKGVTAAAIEVLTEKIGGVFGLAYGEGAVTNKVAAQIARRIENSGVLRFGLDVLSEGAEEGLSDVLNIFADHLQGFDDGDMTVWQEIAENKDDILYDMLLGSITAVFGAGAEAMGGKYGTSTAAENLMNMKPNTTRQTESDAQSIATSKSGAEAKLSIREMNGEKTAWIDEDITKAKPKDESTESYIKQYIGNQIAENGTYLSTLPDSGMKVYAETKHRTAKSKHGLADEYVRSTYSQWLKSTKKGTFKAKMKAAGVLNDLVSIANGRRWEKTKHTGNKDASHGVYYYDSTFAFPVKNAKGDTENVRAYDCQLVILNASDGKKYLYDVVDIKENTNKANDILHMERQKAANTTARQVGVYKNTVQQQNENVNTQNSANENTARPDGRFEAVYRGQVGEIVSIAKNGDSFAVRLRTPDGKQVDVTENKLTFDSRTQELLDAVRPYEHSTEMLTSYDEQTNGDIQRYALAFNTAAEIYGKSTALTAQQAYESSMKTGGAAASMTQEQFTQAFNLGRSRKDSRVQNSATRQGGTGTLTYSDVDYGGVRYKAADENMISADERDVLSAVAKAVGVDICLYQTEAENGSYKGANGFYRNGTVYLDVHAGANKTTEQSAVLLTAAHELTHYMRENNAEGYQQLRDFVTEHLIDKGMDIEALAARKIAREDNPGEMTLEDAVEEVIADSCEMMLEHTRLPEIMAKEKPGLYEQVRSWLKAFVEKLRRAFSGVEVRHAEARAMLSYAEEMQTRWDNALADAARKTVSTGEAESGDNTKVNKNRANKRMQRVGLQLPSDTTTYGSNENQSVRQTLYADDTHGASTMSNTQAFNDNIPQRGTESNTKFSVREELKDELERVKNRELEFKNQEVLIGDTSDFLVNEIGFKPLPFYMPATKAYRAIVTEKQAINDGQPTGGNIHYHGLGVDTVYEILNRAEEPLAAYASTDEADNEHGKRIVIVTDVDVNGDLGVVVVEPDLMARKDGGRIAANKSITLYSKRSITKAVQEAYDQNRLLYINKKSGHRFNSGRQGSNRPMAISENVRKKNIQQFWGNVKWRGLKNSGAATAGDMSNSTMAEAFKRAREKSSEGKSSRRDVATDDTAEELRGRQESYADLRRQNAKLKAQAEYWRGQTRETKEAAIRKADTDAFARRLTEQLYNKGATEDVKAELKEMGDYIVQTDGAELSYTELKDWASAIADHILSGASAEIDNGQQDSLRELRAYLKDTKLKMDKREFADLPEGWRRAHRRIRLSEDGLPVDVAWMELGEMFGKGVFPESITAQSDMVMHIAELEQEWQPTWGNPFENYMGEMREAVAQDILDTMLSDEIRQTEKTMADRARDRLDKQRADDRARYEELRARKNERIEQVYREGLARKQEAVARERAAKWAKVEEVKAYYQNQAERARQRRTEREGIRKYKESVTEKAEKLTSWLLNNSAKEHVPEALKETVGGFLATIDFSSKQKLNGRGETQNDMRFGARLSTLKDLLENQRKYLEGQEVDSAADLYLDMPDDVMEQLREFVRIANKYAETGKSYTVNDMGAEELRHLDALLDVLTNSVKKANVLLANSRYRTVQQAGQSSIASLDALGKNSKAGGLGAAEFAFWDNTTPFYAFQRFGEGGKAIFDGLSRGWEQLAFNAKKIIDFTNELYKANEARSWREERHEVELENGDKFTISTTQLMSLHCLMKREQAMGHILGGGLRISNIGKRTKAVIQTEHVKPNNADLLMLDGLLTERQREVADRMQEFMVKTCGEWGNEVSMKRFGYRGFGEENYFPIQTDANDRPAVDPDAKANDMFRLLNLSATKALTQRANSALVVSDIFEVFTDHASDMAKYNALALPILDTIKWYNYKEKTNVNGLVYTDTVQRAVERAYGTAAKRYVVTFLKDLNGKHEGGTSRSDALTKKMISNYKASAVGANVRVIVQQPTAYVRAAMEINPKYLAAALKPGKDSAAEMEKYSGMAVWKGLGFVSTDIGRSMRSQIMHDETRTDRVKEAQMKGAELADRVTWGALWRACKLETADKTGLTGDELCEATAERFRSVVLKTQVVDATITRSHNMRNQGILASISTSFMAEPTLSYNILLDAYANYRADMRTESGSSKQRMNAAWAKNKNQLCRAMAVLASSSAATVIAASLWDAARDDDDYETYWQKFWQALWGEKGEPMEGNVMEELLLLNKLPVVKDAIAILLHDDEAQRMDMQAITNLKKALDIDLETIKIALELQDEPTQKTYNGKMTPYGKLAANLRALSQLSGIGFYNGVRDAVAIYNTVAAPYTGRKVESYEPSTKSAIKNAYVNGFISEAEASEELINKGIADNGNAAFWIINEWNGDDGQSETIQQLLDAVRARDTEGYNALMDELTAHGVLKGDVQSNVMEQVEQWYTGTKTERASISKQEALELVERYGGRNERNAEIAVEKWTCQKVTGIAYGDIGSEYINGNISESRALELQAKYGYGDTSKQSAAEIAENKAIAEKKLMEWKLKKDTGISAGGESFTGIRNAYNAGLISIEDVYEYRIKYACDTPEKAANTAYRYEWIDGETEMNSITGNQAHNYDKYVAGSGISKLDYWNIIEGHGADTFSADLKPGGGYVAYSKRAKIWEYIDSLELTREQKDAIAGVYAEQTGSVSYTKLEEAPWNQ